MDLRSNLLTYAIGARHRIGFAHGGGANLLSTAVPADPAGVERHRADDWLALAEVAGAESDENRLVIPVSDDARSAAIATLSNYGIRAGDAIVGVHPGASSEIKRWNRDRFAMVADALTERFGVRVVVFGEPNSVDPPLQGRSSFVTLQPSLQDLPGLLERCRVLICNDSGPMHIAAAVGTPVVAIFGSGKPEWFAPREQHHRVAIQSGYACRPCFDHCRYSQPFCIRTIEADRVIQYAVEILSTELVSPAMSTSAEADRQRS
jgi:ADP-heptose:LPS heptosyltransferase